MKKLVTAFAACMIAGLVSAQVESQNIVGYQTKTTSAGNFQMFGAVFTPVSDSAQTIAFSDLVSGDFQAGDQVQFLQSDGTYKILNYYVGNLMSSDYTQFTLTGWGSGGIEDDYNLTAGDAFWIKTTAAVEITEAGQVQLAVNNTLTIPAGSYTMVSAPYPVEYNLSDLAFAGVQAGDQVQFLQSDGTYKILNYYVGNLMSSDYTQFTLTGWGSGGVEADYTISTGEGFWVKTAAETTISFTSPL